MSGHSAHTNLVPLFVKGWSEAFFQAKVEVEGGLTGEGEKQALPTGPHCLSKVENVS